MEFPQGWFLIDWLVYFSFYKMSTYPNALVKFENEFTLFVSQEMGSGLVSFELIFEALQFEIFIFKFHSLEILKNSKNPGIQPIYY